MRSSSQFLFATLLILGCGDGNGTPNFDYIKDKCPSACVELEGYFNRCSFDYFDDGESEADCIADVEASEGGCESEIEALLGCYSSIFWHQVECTEDALYGQLDTCSEEVELWRECQQPDAGE